MKNLKWKLLTIVGVIVFAAAMIYPPFDTASRRGRISLGLDLKGGVQLVLRVKTDEALQYTSEDIAERLRLALREKNIAGPTITVTEPTRIGVAGVPQPMDGAFRALADALPELVAQYTRTSAAGGYTFELKPNIDQTLRTQAVAQALQTVERRVNALGVSEPIVAPYGTAGDQILVQLPGVSDPDQVKRLIGTTALLELKIVEGGPAASQEALLQATGGVAPPEMEVVTGADRTNPGTLSYYLVRKVAPVTGRDLSNARASVDENNLPAVAFSMNRAGAVKFGNLTGENIGKPMAVILDGRVETVATIQGRITDNGQIFGNFTSQDVADMSLMLRSGALPAGLTYLEERTVGPTLGADSIRAGLLASLGGLLLVAIFMLVYYKLSGTNAILSIVLNLLILLAFCRWPARS